MSETAPPILGSGLDPDLRHDLEAVSAGVPVDDGGGASLLKVFLLAELIVAEQLNRVVEIGVYRGRLFLPLGRLMARLGRGEMVGIDPYSAEAAVQRDVELEAIDLVQWPSTIDWEGMYRDVRDAVERWEMGERARLIRKRGEDAAGEFADAPIDLLHVDGNHDREAVSRDVELYLPHLRDGGLLVMDDIAWPSVRPVYEELRSRYELVFELVEKGLYLCPQGGANDFAVLRVRKDDAG
ncbi:MAG TPA: class I SAM-dependent methyltransferase [Solirubrobacterales bacterium]|nr:class I SAM-dependent methyltransferase [Solirubrobacterales bacterium]